MANKIEVSAPFEEDRQGIEAEIEKINKMTEKERKEYLKTVEAEMQRLQGRYVEQYGQESWDKLQEFTDNMFKENE